ncbi:MAG: response regulator [Burkholderiales bacterium]|nr:response regulator [Burkholderiales bacterium]
MRGWISRSVRGKLLAVVIITTCAALAVAAAALIAYDVRSYEASSINDLSTLADVLGTACGPALAFNDQREAEENLTLLRVRPSILAGALFDARGKLYAVYAPEQLGDIALLQADAMRPSIGNGRLSLAKPVLERGERVGTLYLVARYEAVQRLIHSAIIVGVVVFFSLLVAVGVSTWLGRTLSTPIRDIATAAHRVMEHRDYSVRVAKTTEDEIGYLVDTFNAMLDEVGRRAAALEEADRRKDQFLAVLSHELRNPLNPILNAVAVMRMGDARKGNIEWAGEVIERQARQLARLLDDLMDVARITRNKIELRMQTIDVRRIVDMAAEATRAQFDANGQTLQVSAPERQLYLRADPARMAQVLGNILNNAAKYTGRGGLVRVSVADSGGNVIISVKDSGIGIARDDLSRLFEMFTQLPGGADRTGGGLGIGLALVRALVEMHGGHVEAKSEGLGAGSEFIVTMPQAPAPSSNVQQRGVDSAPAPDQRLKILVADDIADSAHSLALGIQILGHEVRTAADGKQALESAESFRPDMAILDIGMPAMTGYDVARRIRETAWGKNMLLVALTGWGQREDVKRATAAGFDLHMTKPADFATIRGLLRDLAARKGEPQAARG